MLNSEPENSDEIELIAENLENLDLGARQVQLNYSSDLKIRSHTLRKSRFPLINYERIKEETLTEIMSQNQNQASSIQVPSGTSSNPSGTTSSLEPLSRNDIQLLLQSIPEYYPGENLSIFINEVDNLCTHLEGGYCFKNMEINVVKIFWFLL